MKTKIRTLVAAIFIAAITTNIVMAQDNKQASKPKAATHKTVADTAKKDSTKAVTKSKGTVTFGGGSSNDGKHTAKQDKGKGFQKHK